MPTHAFMLLTVGLNICSTKKKAEHLHSAAKQKLELPPPTVIRLPKDPHNNLFPHRTRTTHLAMIDKPLSEQLDRLNSTQCDF
jgi:hypothetical protein